MISSLSIKRKSISILLIFSLILSFYMLETPNKHVLAATTGTVVTSGGNLNLRKAADINAEIITSLSNGTKVTILATSGDWYNVSAIVNGTTYTGYVTSTYVAVDNDNSTNTQNNTTQTGDSPATTYRTEVTYKAISVAAKTVAIAKLYKSNGLTRYKISKKYIRLAKGKSLKIKGEKLINGKKWFKVYFKYNKKYRTAYLRNNCVKMTLKTSANSKIYNLKKAAKVHIKKGANSEYKKISGKIVSVKKGSTVYITKDVKSNKTRWYKIKFKYSGKNRTGYVSSKYVKLTKKKVTTKVELVALSDKEFEEDMTKQGFPESYKNYLRKLHAKYPYWRFQAFKPGIKWSTAISKESALGLNLITNSKSAAWKSKEAGAYDSTTGKWVVFDGTSWVAASKNAIKYYMDPRNFLNESTVFQFELLEFQSTYQLKSGVQTIFNNSPLTGSFSYYNSSTKATSTITYADAYMVAAKESGVSPYHLASRTKQEIVVSATKLSSIATGNHSTYPGIFNFYNIGASNGSNAVLKGLKWASTGTTYMRPWNDRYKAIVGGAKFIGASYINKGQNTLYLEKFNMSTYERYNHQYMANVEAAYEESVRVKKAYAGAMDKTAIIFSIPVYEDMPETACSAPS